MIASPSAVGVRVRAPAKLNLFFEVIGTRSDGFHEIETLMTPIDLCDDLSFEPNNSGQITTECRWKASNLQNSYATLGELPEAQNNLATRALKLLQQRAGVQQGGHLNLVKRIPAAAGLGGGSSDAAAALVAANLGWRLNWSRDQLSVIAAELGSDVPFFLYGSPAICRGRGERIEPITGLGRWHAVVVRPPVGLSTAAVYQTCRPGIPAKSVDLLVNVMRDGDLRHIGTAMANQLQAAAETISPWIARLQGEFDKLECVAAQMSGSGSSYFGIFSSARKARRAGAILSARSVGRVFVVRVGM